jgi:hypothetical protein
VQECTEQRDGAWEYTVWGDSAWEHVAQECTVQVNIEQDFLDEVIGYCLDVE